MKSFIALIFLAVFAQSANAAIAPQYQDLKLPTQAMIEHQHLNAVAAANNNLLLLLNAGDTTGAGANVSTFLAQPDVPRNIVLMPGASTAGYGAFNSSTAVVTGTDIFGKVITENFTVGASQATLITGSKAFKTVSSVAFPAENSPYQGTWSVGVGSKIGLKRCLERAGDIGWAELNGVRESTFPTVASTPTAVSGNTAALSSALNGTDVDLYFVQNFRCLP